MKLYKIRDWDDHYENNRSRTVKDLSWVPIPNRHDGEHFTQIMAHKRGAEIFSAFVLMLQIASKCNPRGTLIRSNGTPHTGTSMSVKCRAPVSWFEVALEYLESNTDWLAVEDVNTKRQEADSTMSPSCQSGAQEGKEGKERREGNGALSPTEKISLEQELKRIGTELKELGSNQDYDRDDPARKRIVALRDRRTELRSQLGVVA